MSQASLPKPKSALAEVLHGLITRAEISEQDYNLNSFRTRLSDLRLKYNIPVRFSERKTKNRHGHTTVYRVHYLWRLSIPRATRIYLKINAHG